MMRRPTVRFITRKWAPAVGGMETYCLELTDHLKDEVDLDILALSGRKDGRAPSALSLALFGMASLVKLLFLPKVDVTHVSDMSSWPLGFFAKLRHRSTRIVFSAHGSDLSFSDRDGVLPKLYKAYMRFGAKCLPRSKVLANSNWILQLAKKSGFANVELIPLASSVNPPAKRPKSSQSLFFAGRIMASKGTSFFVKEVLPRLPENISLRIAGTVWEDTEKSIFEHPRVTYLGRLNTLQLAEEYSAALAVIVPSLAPEGFGLVAAEAAIAGGAVIVSDHTGLSEVCSDGVGILADTMDPEDWANKIKTVLNWSAQDRDTFLSTAQEKAQARYNWSRVGKDTLDAYSPLF